MDEGIICLGLGHMLNLTKEERDEYRHIYHTRLAILESTDPPSSLDHNMASEEATEHIKELRRQRFKDMRDNL